MVIASSFMESSARLVIACGILMAFTPSSVSAAYVIPSQAVHQGHGTAVLKATATVSARYAGLDSLQPRGSDIPLSAVESDYLCSLQRAVPKHASTALVDWFAHIIADVIGRDARLIMSVLKDPAYCQPSSAVARLRKTSIIIHLDARGVVVSSNPVWNACITGQSVTLNLIRSNTDRVQHRQGGIWRDIAMTCRDYHRGSENVWRHPDFPELELQLDNRGRLIGGVPTGFIVKNDAKRH